MLLVYYYLKNKNRSLRDRHLVEDGRSGDRVFKQPMDLKPNGPKTLDVSSSAPLSS